MLVFLREWVLNIATLAIFIVLLEILIPTGKVKKFVNLVSGFILIIAIVNPLLGLLNKGVDLKELQITDSNFIDRKEVEADSKILNEKQMKLTIEVYRENIIKRLEDSARETEGVAEAVADVIINENYLDENFGEIKRVYLNLIMGSTGTGIKPIAKIKKVEVNGGKAKEQPVKMVDSKIRNQLESKINKLFGVEKEDIVIALQDG